MIKWFKKESRILRSKITTRVLIITLAVIALAVSGTMLMAGWVDDSGENSSQIIYTDPATGNVGIGTANPSFKLDVAGFFRADNFVMSPLDLYNNLDFYYFPPNVGRKTLRFFGNGAGTTLDVNILDGNLQVYSGHLMVDKMILSHEISGNLIDFFYNTPNIGTKTLRFYGNGGGSTLNIQLLDGSLTVAGTTTSTNYACSSDVRYKKNISHYQNALQKILGLQGVNYFWKTDEFKDHNFSKDKQIGFIAQEVKKVIPELVYTDDKGYKTMSYDRLTAVLVEAVKELKLQSDAKISALEKENTELKQRLAKLDAVAERLAKLEKVVESTQFAQK